MVSDGAAESDAGELAAVFKFASLGEHQHELHWLAVHGVALDVGDC